MNHRWPLLPAAALLAALFAVNVYRAATQSVTVDEALTYNHFIAPAGDEDPMVAAAPFNDNLGTTLAEVSVSLFGASDLALRLPAVLSGAVYFIALLAICWLLFDKSPLWFLLAIAVNSLNPYLLDYFSAARGYGPAIAFWTVGAYFGLRRRWLLAGVGFGLSAASHVSAIFGVAAMETALIAVVLLTEAPSARRQTAESFAKMLGITLVIAATLGAPIFGARASAIDGVVGRYLEGVRSLVDGFFFYKPTLLSPWEPLHRKALWPFAALAAGLAYAVVRIAVRRARDAEKDSAMLLFALATLLAFAELAVEPRVFHHGFLAERRLLFTLPLVFLSSTLLVQWLPRVPAAAGATLLVWLTAVFALEFNTRFYLGWEQDADTKPAMAVLRGRAPAAAGPATIGAGMFLEESLNYERALRGPAWVQPVARGVLECPHDFYYLLESDFDRVKRFGVEPIFKGATARTVLAARSAESVRRHGVLRDLAIRDEPECEADLMTDWQVLENSAPESQRAMLWDVMPGTTGKFRWTYRRPAFWMHAGPGARLFRLDFEINPATFAKTGPVELTLFINGREIGRRRYTAPGEYFLEAAVPANVLRADGLALVETTLDRYMVAAGDGQQMGYRFVRAAFK